MRGGLADTEGSNLPGAHSASASPLRRWVALLSVRALPVPSNPVRSVRKDFLSEG
jgi:hypothetical protein